MRCSAQLQLELPLPGDIEIPEWASRFPRRKESRAHFEPGCSPPSTPPAKPSPAMHTVLLRNWILQYTMVLCESPVPPFLEGGTIPIKHTCDGIDVSPPFRWEDVPEGSKSFALTVTDPDAPMQWIHWLVCDLPADARLIPEGGPVPIGAKEIRNDFGKEAYGGPCPPQWRTSLSLHALCTGHGPSAGQERKLRRTVQKAHDRKG